MKSDNIIKMLPLTAKILNRIEKFKEEMNKEFGEFITVEVEYTNYQIDALVKLVSDVLHITITDLLKGKKGDAVLARHLAVYLVHEYVEGATLKQIGEYFMDKHHSTIINSCNVFKDLMDSKNEKMMDFYNRCNNAITQLIQPCEQHT